nr:hypothetical protein [Tanacetum cinerariifolium]
MSHAAQKIGKGTLELYYEGKVKYVETLKKELETLKEEKAVVDGKLARLRKSSKDLEDIIESQRSDKVKEGVGYNAVPPPAADLYRSPKKDLSWTGLPEFADDTVTDYSRPSLTVESTSAEGDRPAERPTTNKVETAKNPAIPSHRSYGAPMRPLHGPAGHRPHGPPMRSNMNGV